MRVNCFNLLNYVIVNFPLANCLFILFRAFEMSAGPSRDRDNNWKYESGYQKRKRKVVKSKESEVLQQVGFLKFLKPANIKEDIFK
jgi:hypothetical protein